MLYESLPQRNTQINTIEIITDIDKLNIKRI
jgi:hypothetical protein